MNLGQTKQINNGNQNVTNDFLYNIGSNIL